MTRANEQAFPIVYKIKNGYAAHLGITIREHAAIELRIPHSGDDQIDAMIRKANRRDLAKAAMQGRVACSTIRTDDPEAYARDSVKLADALIVKLEKEAE